MPYLIISVDSQDYKVIQLATVTRLGRGDHNDIVLNDPEDTSISRFHAYIEKVDESYLLVDRSTNGTQVNNENIKEYTLFHGAVFNIFDYRFTFIDDLAAVSIDQPITLTTEDSKEVEATTIIRKRSGDPSALKSRLLKEGIVIESEKMLTLYKDIQEVARVNVPVIVTGEPGTGKEKVAHFLHTVSNTDGDIIPLNCSSIPEGIFESELFGSVKGAFHNATDKPGKLELANNGTIFLDEIGDMHLSIQPKLLRFIEDMKVTRLGATTTKTINTRIVSATNQDLNAMIKENSFRPDLYQRLACIKLCLPPLRERKEDILPLTEFFLSRISEEHNLKRSSIARSAKNLLEEYHWPGNIRELKNILMNVMIRNQGKTITADTLTSAADEIQSTAPIKSTQTFLSMHEMEKNHIIEALELTGGNKTVAAKLLDISRDTLYKKIQRYNISDI